eukprot:1837176-Rhodomonas_salina.1
MMVATGLAMVVGTDIGTPQNTRQETAFPVQFVPGMRVWWKAEGALAGQVTWGDAKAELVQ